MLPNPKFLRSGLLLFSVAVLFFSVAGLQAQDESVLRVGMLEPVNLDPATGSNDDEILINRHIYDYLVEIVPSGDLVPSLAESWEISDDGLTYTFNLVEDATFHDGTPLTAADVVYTFNRLVEVGSSAVGLLGQEAVGEDDEGNAILEPTWTVEAADENTVVFTLDAPNADFLFGVASRFAGILPEGQATPNVIGEDGSLANFNGTGPFRIEEFNAGESITLVANDDYWAGRPELDRIEMIFINDTNTQVDALRNGEVDFIYKIDTALLPNLEDAGDVTVVNAATNTHPVIRLRADEGSLGEDVRIRQAFKMATDRELLNIDVLGGQGTVGNNDPIGPVYGALYNEQPDQYDPAMACELIAEYAAENPDSPFIVDNGGTPTVEVEFYVVEAFEYPLLGEFIAQQWEEGCINVELIIRPENIYYGDNEWLTVDLGLTGWGTRPTPQEYLSVAYTTGAPFNEAHWSNPQLDELAAQAAQTADPDERAVIYAEISAIFAEEGPIIIPFFRPVAGAYANNVQGLEMHPFPGRTDFDSVTIGG